MVCCNYFPMAFGLLMFAVMVDCEAGTSIEGRRIIELTGEQTDAVHINVTGARVSNLTIRDRRHYNTAHRDAIQLIPPRKIDKGRRVQIGNHEQDWVLGDQLTGTVLKGVTVRNCTIHATRGPLQGIFGGDGLFTKLRLLNNHIQTAGSHSITINGLLDGEIKGNVLRTVNNNTPAIRLYPARIGGNLAEEGMVYILDFADEKRGESKLQYNPLIIGNNYLFNGSGKQNAKIIDNRANIPNIHILISFGLKRFRYNAFIERFSNLTFGEYRRQNGGRDFAQLKAWLEQRVVEYSSGKRIMQGALPGIPAGDERRMQILPLLRRALVNAVNSHALDHVSLSNFPETPVRAFTAKQLALDYGQLQPLVALNATDKGKLLQMEKIRRATLKYLLPDSSIR